MRTIIVIALMLVWLAWGGGKTLASGFHISSIGEVETGGRQLSKFWHSSTKPAFRGEAMPGAEVIVEIDGKALSVNADSAGEWVFTPVDPLSEGSHSVVVKSGGSEVRMELVTGSSNVDWEAVDSGGGETLPTVGFFLPTLFLMGGGSSLVLAAKRLTK